MKLLFLLGTLALAACAPMQPLPDNLTVDQRIQIMQMRRLPMRDDTFVMPQMPVNRAPTRCHSTRSGQTTDTFCY